LFNAEIKGTGMYVPEKVLTNFDLEKLVDTSDEWISERTGIKERRIAAEDQAPSDLALEASKIALKSAGLEAKNLDMIIVCTSTPDIIFPSTACFLQKKLDAGNCAAYDISAVCSGFIFGLSIAEQYIKSGRYQNILVVASEVNSRIVDWKDRSTCIIFGDGAGAVVLSKTESSKKTGLLSTHIYSDGGYSELIQNPGGFGKERISQKALDDNKFVIKMDGGPTFKLAVRRMTEVSLEALKFNEFSLEDVDWIIPHQANQRIIDAVGAKLKVPVEKVAVNIHKYGNTSAASIPIALHEWVSEGKIKSGDLILMPVLGAGLTWGAALVKW
jgi:3-oxoacyl-[acyl-carrier-protein] synthase III